MTSTGSAGKRSAACLGPDGKRIHSVVSTLRMTRGATEWRGPMIMGRRDGPRSGKSLAHPIQPHGPALFGVAAERAVRAVAADEFGRSLGAAAVAGGLEAREA